MQKRTFRRLAQDAEDKKVRLRVCVIRKSSRRWPFHFDYFRWMLRVRTCRSTATTGSRIFCVSSDDFVQIYLLAHTRRLAIAVRWSFVRKWIGTWRVCSRVVDLLIISGQMCVCWLTDAWKWETGWCVVIFAAGTRKSGHETLARTTRLSTWKCYTRSSGCVPGSDMSFSFFDDHHGFCFSVYPSRCTRKTTRTMVVMTLDRYFEWVLFSFVVLEVFQLWTASCAGDLLTFGSASSLWPVNLTNDWATTVANNGSSCGKVARKTNPV